MSKQLSEGFLPGIQHVSLTESCTCGLVILERANHVRPPRNVAAEFTMRGVETLGWPMLTETREWEGVPWYSAVEIARLHSLGLCTWTRKLVALHYSLEV